MLDYASASLGAGSFGAALAALLKKAKFAPDAKVQLIPYPPTQNTFEKWFTDEKLLGAAMGGIFSFEKPAYVDEIRRALRPAMRQGGMMRWMPYKIDIN